MEGIAPSPRALRGDPSAVARLIAFPDGGVPPPPKSKPLELLPEELDNLMSTEDNAVVLFYATYCHYCMEFEPTYKALARGIHTTNLQEGSTPIVVAQIDGAKYKDAINALRPGFLGEPPNSRGFPTILFKRSDGVAATWDASKPRTLDNIAEFMADFYGDESLRPDRTHLYEVMNNPDPDFLMFYSDNVDIVPRFESARPLDPHFTGREQAVRSMIYLLLSDPALRSKGLAVPVNLMDRPDLKIPSIYDVRDGTEYAFRDSHKWLLDQYHSDGGLAR